MPRKVKALEPKRRTVEPHVLQAFLKVDKEWVSILLYDSKGAANIGLRKLQRLERDPKHLLRVRKWNGEEISTAVALQTFVRHVLAA